MPFNYSFHFSTTNKLLKIPNATALELVRQEKLSAISSPRANMVGASLDFAADTSFALVIVF